MSEAAIEVGPGGFVLDAERGTRVYVAGPMSGIEDYNFPAFKAAAIDLRERGYDVLSPVEMDEEAGISPDDFKDEEMPQDEYADVLARDIYKIATTGVQATVVLPGWEHSGGAKTEVAFCRARKLPVFAYHGPDNPLQAVPDLVPLAAARESSGEQRIVNAATGGEKCRKSQRFELLPWAELGDVAELYAFGATKYDDNNWMRGFDWSLSIGALGRHYAQWIGGESIDEETGCSHLTSVVFHALALLYFEKHFPELDDRAVTKLAEER